MKILKYPTLLISLFFTTQLYAYDAAFSLGNICEFVGKIQTNENGGTNTCSFMPYVSGSVDFPLTTQFAASPELGFTFPKSGRDTKISKMNIIALMNSKYSFSMFHSLLGVGLYITRISSSGGTEDLNNGNGTSSFPLPDSTTYSRNTIINLGAGLDFNKQWSADLHTYIFNLLESEDRAFSIVFNGTYHFGEF